MNNLHAIPGSHTVNDIRDLIKPKEINASVSRETYKFIYSCIQGKKKWQGMLYFIDIILHREEAPINWRRQLWENDFHYMYPSSYPDIVNRIGES